MTNKGITILLGDDDTQMTNKLSREFASGFEALGFSTHQVIASSLFSFNTLKNEILTHDTGLFISLSGQGMDMNSENNVFEEFNIPFLLMLLDPPLHYWDKVSVPVGLTAISTLSETDKHFIDIYSSQRRTLFQLAHAATPKLRQPWAKKDIGLFYCGTLRENPKVQREGWSKHGELIQKRLNAILEEHLSKNGVSLVTAIIHVLSEEIDCSQAMALHPYYVTLDLYLRDYHRVQTLKSIDSVPLVLAGGGWETVLNEFYGANIKYLGRIHPNQVGTFYERAKVILNTINTYHESHERVFSALAAGSVALTSTSEFYRRAFSENEIVFFDWQETNLNEKCHSILANESHLQDIAKNGQLRFLNEHTWRHRARSVLKVFGLI